MLKKGEIVTLVGHDPASSQEFHGWKTDKEIRIPVNYNDLGMHVLPTTKVLIADGNIQLEITEVCLQMSGPVFWSGHSCPQDLPLCGSQLADIVREGGGCHIP